MAYLRRFYCNKRPYRDGFLWGAQCGKKHLNAHDLFFKGAMQHKEMAQEFFIANIPKNILGPVELSKLFSSHR